MLKPREERGVSKGGRGDRAKMSLLPPPLVSSVEPVTLLDIFLRHAIPASCYFRTPHPSPTPPPLPLWLPGTKPVCF